MLAPPQRASACKRRCGPRPRQNSCIPAHYSPPACTPATPVSGATWQSPLQDVQGSGCQTHRRGIFALLTPSKARQARLTRLHDAARRVWVLPCPPAANDQAEGGQRRRFPPKDEEVLGLSESKSAAEPFTEVRPTGLRLCAGSGETAGPLVDAPLSVQTCFQNTSIHISAQKRGKLAQRDDTEGFRGRKLGRLCMGPARNNLKQPSMHSHCEPSLSR